jgi:translation initiation factor 2 beta subunit (eIF-2beta)/eIF-5
MRRSFKVEKLSDEFGQCDLVLKCEACGHEQRTVPRTLANIAGWEAKLGDVTRRLRCSKCGERKCVARALPSMPPRGYKSH